MPTFYVLTAYSLMKWGLMGIERIKKITPVLRKLRTELILYAIYMRKETGKFTQLFQCRNCLSWITAYETLPGRLREKGTSFKV